MYEFSYLKYANDMQAFCKQGHSMVIHRTYDTFLER